MRVIIFAYHFEKLVMITLPADYFLIPPALLYSCGELNRGLSGLSECVRFSRDMQATCRDSVILAGRSGRDTCDLIVFSSERGYIIVSGL